jgi:predicted DCC family thiol-disulfide oxidoreductase YuxK
MPHGRGSETHRPIIFFDADCLLCSGGVQFILRHERQPRLNFAPINGQTWQTMFGARDTSGPPQTIVVVDDAGVYTKSKAVLRIQRHMGGAWKWLGRLSSIVPSFVRDFLYDVIARNRYKWFGQTHECLLPTPENRGRFLE